MAAGGALVATAGAFLTIGFGTTTTIGFLSLTGPQTFALGALVYNSMIFLAPLIGIKAEPIEYGSSNQPALPRNNIDFWRQFK